MTRIVVDPNRLRSLSAQFAREANRLNGIEGKVNSATARLQWEVRQKAHVDGKLGNARNLSRSLESQAQQLSRYLNRKADIFTEADTWYRGGGNQAGPFYARFVCPGWRFPEDVFRIFIDRLGEVAPWLLCVLPPSALIAIALGQHSGPMLERLLGGENASKLFGICTTALKPLLTKGSRLVKVMPVIGVVVGTLLDLQAKGDYSESAIRQAWSRNLTSGALELIPYVGPTLAISAGVQLGGSALIWGSTETTKWIVDPNYHEMLDSSAGRCRYALEKLDLGNMTDDLGDLLYHMTGAQHRVGQSFWANPSIGGFARAMAPALAGPLAPVVTGLMDSQARGEMWGDIKSFGGHLGDLVVASGDVPYEGFRHLMTTGGTLQNQLYAKVLPSGISSSMIGVNEYLVEEMNSQWRSIPKIKDINW